MDTKVACSLYEITEGLGNVRKSITKCKALMKPRKLAELYKLQG